MKKDELSKMLLGSENIDRLKHEVDQALKIVFGIMRKELGVFSDIADFRSRGYMWSVVGVDGEVFTIECRRGYDTESVPIYDLKAGWELKISDVSDLPALRASAGEFIKYLHKWPKLAVRLSVLSMASEWHDQAIISHEG